jgi:hypothetical protein
LNVLAQELVNAFTLALVLAIQLGLPVVVLFVMGWLSHQRSRPGGGLGRPRAATPAPEPSCDSFVAQRAE